MVLMKRTMVARITGRAIIVKSFGPIYGMYGMSQINLSCLLASGVRSYISTINLPDATLPTAAMESILTLGDGKTEAPGYVVGTSSIRSFTGMH